MQDLAQETLTLLKEYSKKVMLKQIAGELQLSKDWLFKFHQGKIDSLYKPSAAKIKKLNEFLVSKNTSH